MVATFTMFDRIFSMIDQEKFSCVMDFYNMLKETLEMLKGNFTEHLVLEKIQELVTHLEKVQIFF